MSQASIDTLITAANTAIEGEDWATAESKLIQAKTLLATMPDFQRGDRSARWDRAAIDEAIKYVKSRRASAGSDGSAIRHTLVEHIDEAEDF